MKGMIAVLFVLLCLAGCAPGSVVLNSGSSAVPADVAPSAVADESTVYAGSGSVAGDRVILRRSSSTMKGAEDTDDDDDISTLLNTESGPKFDIPIVFNDAVQYYIRYFSEEKKKVFTNWLRRSRRYVPMIQSVLRERGLPEDLVYLAMIESGFNPKAYSPAKACGPWQFIYATGERYGLKVNYWVDERRDPEKSTVAATKYLEDLFSQFGCWYLAAAGYNAGERRIERAIEKHNTNDFWELVKNNGIPKETSQYIPKLIAAAIIAKDPERHGFTNIAYDKPLEFEEVKVPRGTPLSTIAKAAGIDLVTLRFLNPEILRGITPPNVNSYVIKVPSTVPKSLQRTLAASLSEEKKVTDVFVYKARKGDTTAKVMKKYRLTYADLCLVNDCENDIKVRRGSSLNIPRFGGSADPVRVAARKNKVTAKDDKVMAKREISSAKAKEPDEENSRRREQPAARQASLAAPSKGEKQTTPPVHVVKKGENLTSISNRYGVDVESLRSFNNLKTDTVYPSMKLRLVSYREKKRGLPVRYHVVKKGENLTSIANRYGAEVTDLKSWNSLKTDKVFTGMKLKIVKGPGQT
jgi:membrane-bound lytic murein transglycosylase D